MRMSVESPEIRALISLTCASATPGIATLATSPSLDDPMDAVIGVAIWSAFSLFVVVPLGMMAYYALRRSRIPFLVSAPIIGALVGVAVACSLYGQGILQTQLMQFVVVGVSTGLVAVAIDQALSVGRGHRLG
jgi:uncharacterized membrane protein YhfC